MENKNKSEKRIKKPSFVVKESKFSSRVKSRWRFPRGMHSKVRQRHKGRPPLPHPGYGSPRIIRNLVAGLKPIVVNNLLELSKIKDGQGAILSGTLGKRKKLSLLEEAKKREITILNVKNLTVLITKIQDEIIGRKKSKQEKVKDKDKKLVEKKKKAEEKEKKETDTKKEKKEVEAEDVKKESEEQKKFVEKTITKRQ